jgi:hypothetical protein
MFKESRFHLKIITRIDAQKGIYQCAMSVFDDSPSRFCCFASKYTHNSSNVGLFLVKLELMKLYT